MGLCWVCKIHLLPSGSAPGPCVQLLRLNVIVCLHPLKSPTDRKTYWIRSEAEGMNLHIRNWRATFAQVPLKLKSQCHTASHLCWETQNIKDTMTKLTHFNLGTVYILSVKRKSTHHRCWNFCCSGLAWKGTMQTDRWTPWEWTSHRGIFSFSFFKIYHFMALHPVAQQCDVSE